MYVLRQLICTWIYLIVAELYLMTLIMTWFSVKFEFKFINMIVLIFGTCGWHVWEWCRELHGKRDCHESWRRLKLSFPLGALGTMGIESWCLLLVLCFWSFVICCAFLWLCLCLVYGHTTLFVMSYCYWFSWFSSCLFLLVFYVVRVLGVGLGKRKFSGTQGKLN